MSEEQMVAVAYIGQKPHKVDNVANSGVVWIGAGDVQPVPASLWPLLAKHPDVWALADGEAVKPQPLATDEGLGKQEAPAFVLIGADEKQLDLATLDDVALKAFIKEHGLGNPGARRGDKLRQFIVDAVKAG